MISYISILNNPVAVIIAEKIIIFRLNIAEIV